MGDIERREQPEGRGANEIEKIEKVDREASPASRTGASGSIWTDWHGNPIPPGLPREELLRRLRVGAPPEVLGGRIWSNAFGVYISRNLTPEEAAAEAIKAEGAIPPEWAKEEFYPHLLESEPAGKLERKPPTPLPASGSKRTQSAPGLFKEACSKLLGYRRNRS